MKRYPQRKHKPLQARQQSQTLLLLKLLFTSNLLFVLSFCFGQTDTLIIQRTDTVYVEKVIEKRIKTIKLDTVYLKDTVYVDRVDTIEVNSKKKNKSNNDSNGSVKGLTLGLLFGPSIDYDERAYLSTHEDFNIAKNDATSAVLNTSIGVQVNYHLNNKSYVTLSIKQLTFKERVEYLTIDRVNKLSYLQWTAGYGFLLKDHTSKWNYGLDLSVGFAVNTGSNGEYINPDDLTITGSDEEYFPLRPTLLTQQVSGRVNYMFSDKIMISAQPYFNYRFKSITILDHPVQYLRNEIGLLIGANYIF